MRYGMLGAFFLSMTPLQTATAQAPAAGENAAPIYVQAFASLPALNGDQQKLLAEWNMVPLDGAARDLIGKYRKCRADLHRGAKLSRCDWGLDYGKGLRMVQPHIGKAITLARLAGLNARSEFAQGHWKAGADDVAALLGLARHMELDGMYISSMVGLRIEAIAIDAAAPYLPQSKRALPEAASAVLNAPPGATLAQVVFKERQLGPLWLIQELKTAEGRRKGSWQTVWTEIFDAGLPDSPVQDVIRARTVKSFEQAIETLEGVLPWYDQLARLTSLPPGEFELQYLEFAKNAREANAVAGLLLSNMDRVIAAQRRSQARRALFKAAITVVQGGPAKLKTLKDPFGDGPFEYRALNPGFELKSRLVVNGQPVTLIVGQGNKS